MRRPVVERVARALIAAPGAPVPRWFRALDPPARGLLARALTGPGRPGIVRALRSAAARKDADLVRRIILAGARPGRRG